MNKCIYSISLVYFVFFDITPTTKYHTIFAYFIVFPLIFVFFIGIAPTDVAVMTDIGRYLDFVIALFFAFGFSKTPDWFPTIEIDHI